VAAENSIEHLIIFSGSRQGQPDGEGLQNTIAAGKALAAMRKLPGLWWSWSCSIPTITRITRRMAPPMSSNSRGGLFPGGEGAV
jgi:hypothetical protein